MLCFSQVSHEKFEKIIQEWKETCNEKGEELRKKDALICQLEHQIKELELKIKRYQEDLQKMKNLEEENCQLKSDLKFKEDKIRQLEAELERAKSSSQSQDIDIKKIEELVVKAIDKNPVSNPDDFKEKLEEMMTNFVHKSEMVTKVSSLEKELKEMKRKYEKVVHENLEHLKEKGGYSCEKTLLETEIVELKRKIKDLEQQVMDTRGLFEAMKSEYERLKEKYEELLKKGTCNNCIWLRHEIEMYGSLLTQKPPKCETESSPSSSSSDSSAPTSPIVQQLASEAAPSNFRETERIVQRRLYQRQQQETRTQFLQGTSTSSRRRPSDL